MPCRTFSTSLGPRAGRKRDQAGRPGAVAKRRRLKPLRRVVIGDNHAEGREGRHADLPGASLPREVQALLDLQRAEFTELGGSPPLDRLPRLRIRRHIRPAEGRIDVGGRSAPSPRYFAISPLP